jgi:caffeoyl-CoA O-methyltransferase
MVGKRQPRLQQEVLLVSIRGSSRVEATRRRVGGEMCPMLRIVFVLSVILTAALTSITSLTFAQNPQAGDLDVKVEKFLKENRSQWNDWNIPFSDGKVLYDLVLKNRYRRALEIGTSSGHSAIWIAWALSKTGGKLITIEIDERVYKKALENFRKAGLDRFIDARLGDAHHVVKELKEPFDFVFSDADKEWYTQYFKDVDPKLEVGGCFTAHNVANGFEGTREFLDYVRSLSNYETRVDRSSSSGISISFKKSN